jgi:hypothetical protein
MSHRKKSYSLTLKLATKRSASLASIDPALELGNGLSLASYQAALTDTRSKLASYNTILSAADEARLAFRAAERNLRDLNDRMLAGVASRFGRDSSQYAMAGGTRTSDRRRLRRKPSDQQPEAA